MRLRVGGIRVIYKYGNDNDVIVLFVIEIGTRGDIYKQEMAICPVSQWMLLVC